MALSNISKSHLDQYARLELLFSNNAGAVSDITAFSDRRNAFGKSMLVCYGYRDTANGTTKGFTKAKNAAKKTSSDSASNITGKAVSYAITVKNVDLKDKVNQWTQNFLYKTNDPDYAGVIQKIDDLLFPYTASDPTGTADYFTPSQLADMKKDSDAYETTLNLYNNALSVINIWKSNFKIIQIPVMKLHIVFFDGFMSDLAVDYAGFVSQYKVIIEKLDVLGKRNQGVEALMVYDVDGKVIALVGELNMVNYPVTKKPKKARTNSNGEIPLMKLKVGTWDAVFKAPGCIDQPVTIKVEAKKVTSLIIRMMAAPIIAGAAVKAPKK